ncbi:acylneuraminate cytidylyltransferase family protein [Kamptonema cortianum]|nr:acylneuraminate cytidylyltransferase family protein [Kamptonema cortianum]
MPEKNIRPLGGKPLIAWTIEAARQSHYLDRLILSTDAENIIDVARRHGCEVPFVRPPELAADTTPGIDPVLHALSQPDFAHFDMVVLLQPTSPFRSAEDIDACIVQCAEGDTPSCVSVCPNPKNPAWIFLLDETKTLQPLLPRSNPVLRRQDAAPSYLLNGAVYAIHVPILRTSRTFLPPGTRAHTMPPERSLDIDSEVDFAMAELYLNNSSALWKNSNTPPKSI